MTKDDKRLLANIGKTALIWVAVSSVVCLPAIYFSPKIYFISVPIASFVSFYTVFIKGMADWEEIDETMERFPNAVDALFKIGKNKFNNLRNKINIKGKSHGE